MATVMNEDGFDWHYPVSKPINGREINKGPKAPYCLRLKSLASTLLVVDVHRDFKTKADVTVFWSIPLHDCLLVKVVVKNFSLTWLISGYYLIARQYSGSFYANI
jgi:hypothetical protein